MMMASIFLLSFFSGALDTCPDLQDFQKRWRSGFESSTVKDSQCLESSDDPESLHWRSDLLWWIQDERASRRVADRAVHLLKPDSDGALRVELLRRGLRWGIRGDYAGTVVDQERINHEFGISLSYNYWKTHRLVAGVQRLIRTYPGTSRLQDLQYRLAHTYVADSKFYLENEVLLSPESHFSPRFSALVSPHFVFSDSTDIEIGLRASHYSLNNTWTSSLAIRRDLIAEIFGELRGSFLFRPEIATSGQIMVGRQFGLFLLSLKYSGGEVDEGDGVLDRFQQGSFSGAWNLNPWLKLHIDATIYRADLRDEWRMGSGIECFF
jgi:hypothetical protein